MYTKSLLSTLFATLLSLPAIAVTVADLRCEYRTNPLGIDVTAPRLSWKLESKARGARQTAYQVLVASMTRSFPDPAIACRESPTPPPSRPRGSCTTRRRARLRVP